MLRYYTKYVLFRKEFSLSLLMLTLIAVVSFLSQCANFYGSPVSELIAGEQLFIGRNYSSGFSTIFRTLIPLASAIPLSDIFFMEKQNSILSLTVSRFGSKKRYFINSAIAVYMVSFIVVFIPLLINALLVMLAFPYKSMRDFTGLWAGDSWYRLDYTKNSILFSSLFVKYPYLHNILSTFLISLFSGFSGVFAYSISYLLKKNRMLVYMGFFIIYYGLELLSNGISQFRMNISMLSYLYPLDSSQYKSISTLVLTIVVYLASLVIISTLGRKKLDNLI